MLGKEYRLGKTFDEIEIGKTMKVSESIEDKDLLLYLGLTNDNNPLYIQHDYASQTMYKKPVVPTIMLNGILTSVISKYLPGAGSFVASMNIEYPKPVYHYEMIHIVLEVKDKDRESQQITIQVIGHNDHDDLVLTGQLKVVPPKAFK